jgi:hypothetical protein
VTPLPPEVPFSAALAKLQDHDLLIRLDPELAHYEALPSSTDAPQTKRYKVTDNMRTLPKGLWDTTVTFEALMTNTGNGLEWMIKAPMGLIQKTTWNLVKSTESVQAGEQTGEWSLVEDVEITANRLIVGTVKAKCEENWKGIHQKFIGHLREPQVETAV